jgi:membrane associated rhomboid family serine protease
MIEMEQFLKNSIWGLVLLGALGSISGYLLILLFKYLKERFSTLFFKLSKKRNLNNYKKREADKFALYENHSYRPIILFRITIFLIINLFLFLVTFIIFIEILKLSYQEDVSVPKLYAFLIGIIAGYPMFNIGYYTGKVQAIYESFLDDFLIEKGGEDYIKEIEDKLQKTD